MVLALGPGLVSALIISVFGRRDIASQLCSRVPHKNMDDLPVTISFRGVVDFVLVGRRHQIDYHEWVCRNTLSFYDVSARDATEIVAAVGIVFLLISLAYGLFVLAATVYTISYFSRVPLSEFVGLLRGRPIWPAIGVALMIPVFLTANDWIRWWVIISFNIAIVYILHTLNAPQLEEKPTQQNVRAFVLAVAALALLPMGLVPGFGFTV
jgi:hypothetical protein